MPGGLRHRKLIEQLSRGIRDKRLRQDRQMPQRLGQRVKNRPHPRGILAAERPWGLFIDIAVGFSYHPPDRLERKMECLLRDMAAHCREKIARKVHQCRVVGIQLTGLGDAAFAVAADHYQHALREIADKAVSPEDLKEELVHSLQKYVEVDEPEPEGVPLIGAPGTGVDADDTEVMTDRMSEEELLKGLEGLTPPENQPEPEADMGEEEE